ncbi:MAG: pentapeptide repeat-containing protein [Mycobacterium sp.]
MTATAGAPPSHDVQAPVAQSVLAQEAAFTKPNRSGGRHSAHFEHRGGINGTNPASREPSSNATATRLRQLRSRQQRLRLTQPARPVRQSRWRRMLAGVERNLAKLFGSVDWTKVAAFLTAATAVAALFFTAHSLDSTRDQYSLSERGQLSDRFNKSIADLGSNVTDVQEGGIYSLESLTQDSPHDKNLRIVVFDVLGTYIRGHADIRAHPDCSKSGAPPPDIQAALTVIGRRDHEEFNTFHEKIDLSQACLNAADLRNALLENASLKWTTLTNTTFSEAHLASADLSNALLDNAYLGTNLTKARLLHASLQGASMTGANLTGANLTGANLTRVDLTGADLTGANLTGANLSDITYSESTRWPDGYTPPPSRALT